MNPGEQNLWRKCSSCKTAINLNSQYYVCSVSTCNNQRTGYVFCSVQCFESHLPGARHREAGAIEKRSPAANAPIASETATTAAASGDVRAPARIIVKSASTSTPSRPAMPQEVLIVASRLKEYIQARSEFNTSAGVMDVLSDYVRILCDRAIDNARAEGRKTVLDRDFDFLKKGSL